MSFLVRCKCRGYAQRLKLYEPCEKPSHYCDSMLNECLYILPINCIFRIMICKPVYRDHHNKIARPCYMKSFSFERTSRIRKCPNTWHILVHSTFTASELRLLIDGFNSSDISSNQFDHKLCMRLVMSDMRKEALCQGGSLIPVLESYGPFAAQNRIWR